MKRRQLEAMRQFRREHVLATFARIAIGAIGVAAGVLMIRSLPDLVRYVKMERM
jgi:hypothetical protein